MTHLDAPTIPPLVDLNSGESPIEVWRPQFRYFLFKISFVSIVTALLLGTGANFSLGVSSLLVWLVSLAVSAAFYAFIFDDFFEWRTRKGDIWILTNHRLIYYNPQDDNSPAYLPLDRVKYVRRWMFWAVRVRLRPRDQLMMLFLPDRTAICNAITAGAAHAAATVPQKVNTT